MQAKIKRMIDTLSVAGMSDHDIVLSLCAICPNPGQVIVLLGCADWDTHRLKESSREGPPDWEPGVTEHYTKLFMNSLELGGMSDGECLHSLFCAGIPPVLTARIVAVCGWSFERTMAAIDVAMFLSGVTPSDGMKYN